MDLLIEYVRIRSVIFWSSGIWDSCWYYGNVVEVCGVWGRLRFGNWRYF